VPVEVSNAYQFEIEGTLRRVHEAMVHGVHPLVALAIARSVSWLASHGRGGAGNLACAILDALPTDLGFRIRSALADGFGQVFVREGGSDQWRSRLDAWLNDVAAEAKTAFPVPEALRSCIEEALEELMLAGEPRTSAHVLVNVLMRDDVQLARAWLEDTLVREKSATRSFAGTALHSVMRHDLAEGRGFARRLLDAGRVELPAAVAHAYAGLGSVVTEEDQALVEELLASDEPALVMAGIRAVWAWSEIGPRASIDLLASVGPAGDTQVADELAMVLLNLGAPFPAVLTKDDANRLLASIESIPQLSGHWINELLAVLSYSFPLDTAAFLIARVERAAAGQSFTFRAANPGPHSHCRMRFLESSEGMTVLNLMWSWLGRNQDRDLYFQHAADDAFEAMFLFDDQKLVEFLEPRLDTSTADDLARVGRLLRKASHAFIFTQPSFVVLYLEQCRALGPDLLETATVDLYGSAISGMRSGMSGEPMPRDIQDRDGAQRVLSTLSRSSAAYRLYDLVRKSAVASIDESRREGEELDDC